MASTICTQLGYPVNFNAALLNWYPDGSDYIPLHFDRMSMQVPIFMFQLYDYSLHQRAAAEAAVAAEGSGAVMPVRMLKIIRRTASQPMTKEEKAERKDMSKEQKLAANKEKRQTLKAEKQLAIPYCMIPLNEDDFHVYLPGMQHEFEHAIDPDPLFGFGRISLTFRVQKQEE
jgi:hypothetical protein